MILLDLSMPTLDGLKAAQLIREGSPQAQILIVTNYHSLEAARIAAEVGASGYVTKTLIPANWCQPSKRRYGNTQRNSSCYFHLNRGNEWSLR